MSLFLFCLLVQFVHQIPHMSEIIWYLFFSDWLLSLSIMFSRSIHAVAKGKIFSFFVAKSNLSFIFLSIYFLSHLTLFCCILGELVKLIFQLTNCPLAVPLLLVSPSTVFLILLLTFSTPNVSIGLAKKFIWFFL